MDATGTTVLLRLRWLQLRRAMPPLGMVLLAVGVLGGIWLLRKAVLHDASLAPYIAGGALLAVASLHQRRPDLHFLRLHVPKYPWAMALEYGALVLPVFFGLLLARSWAYAALMPLACAFAWLPVVNTSGVRGAGLRRIIPARLFEWRGALQSTMPWSLLLWLMALGFFWLPLLPLLLLGAIAMMACSAQEQCEPRGMLLVTAPNASALLRTKVMGALRIMLLMQAPVLVAATVFQRDWWWIHGLFGIGMLVLVAFAVVLKYANYQPSDRLSANGANVAVAAVFAILPGLSLVPLIMLITEWPKAIANLRSYFHDPHH